MRRRRISSRRVKLHRSYTVEELSDVTGATEPTVRNWLRRGLPALTSRRPTLILGRDVRAFLDVEANRRKRPTPIGKFFCFRCKECHPPALGIADFLPLGPSHGRLVAICEGCEGTLSRIVSARDLPTWRAFFEIGGGFDGSV